jgi:hypothetical protein
MTASVMTYTSLVGDISSYLERTDAATLDKIPTFIMLAEQVIASEIKFLGNLTPMTSTMTAAQSVIDKPARWHKTVSMNVTVDGEKRPVLLRKYEYLREYWPNPSLTDVPLYYADYDYDNWFVSPTPDQAYQFEVLIYQRLQPLSSTNQTNWITNNAPNAMLFGALLQAVIYLKDDARQIFQQKYDMAMQALKVEDVTRVGDRSAIAVDS